MSFCCCCCCYSYNRASTVRRRARATPTITSARALIYISSNVFCFLNYALRLKVYVVNHKDDKSESLSATGNIRFNAATNITTRNQPTTTSTSPHCRQRSDSQRARVDRIFLDEKTLLSRRRHMIFYSRADALYLVVSRACAICTRLRLPDIVAGSYSSFVYT